LVITRTVNAQDTVQYVFVDLLELGSRFLLTFSYETGTGGRCRAGGFPVPASPRRGAYDFEELPLLVRLDMFDGFNDCGFRLDGSLNFTCLSIQSKSLITTHGIP
jgi:hypothetical protein